MKKNIHRGKRENLKSFFFWLVTRITGCVLPLLVGSERQPLETCPVGTLLSALADGSIQMLLLYGVIFVCLCESSAEKLCVHNVAPDTQSRLKNKCFSSSAREWRSCRLQV